MFGHSLTRPVAKEIISPKITFIFVIQLYLAIKNKLKMGNFGGLKCNCNLVNDEDTFVISNAESYWASPTNSVRRSMNFQAQRQEMPWIYILTI